MSLNLNNSFHILLFNARGVKRQRLELLQFLNQEKVDILLVTETFLKPGVAFQLPGYFVYRTDRISERGGGTLIAVSKHVKHCSLPSLDLVSIENTHVRIYDSDSKNFDLFACYKKPRVAFNREDINELLDSNNQVIIGADLNSKHPHWRSRRYNESGKFLYNYLSPRPDVQIIGPHLCTYLNPNNDSSDVLDIFIFKNVPFPYNIYTRNSLRSDHLPVTLKLFHALSSRNIRAPFKYNWESYKEYLDTHSATFVPHQPEDNIKLLQDRLAAAADQCKKFHSINRDRGILPRNILEYIKMRNRIRRQYQKYRSPSLQVELRRLNSTIKSAIRTFRSELWNQKLESYAKHDGGLWKLVDELKNNTAHTLPSLKDPAGRWVHDPLPKAELLATSLTSQFQEEDPTSLCRNTAHRVFVNNYLEHLSPAPDSDIPEFDVSEVKSVIQNLVLHKAPGADHISAKMLKHLPSSYFDFITELFNECWRTGYYPAAWKESIITCIPKLGTDLSHPQSYRPISLLSILSKVFERLIYNRFQAFTDSQNISKPEQFGFRRNHSCSLQLLRLTELIKDAWSRKSHVLLILLDFQKAFDKVSHVDLIYKMIKLQYPPQLIKLLHHYLQDRTYRVRVNDFYSSSFPIHAGVPQGSILGPSLFNLYVQDFPDIFSGEVLQYADDTALLISTRTTNGMFFRAQKALNKVSAYCSVWKIKLNIEKSCAIIMTKGNLMDPPPLYIQHRPLQYKRESKYLGILLDCKLTWKPHLKQLLSSIKQIYGSLYSILGRSSKLSTFNKLLVLKTFILPKLLYGSCAWGTTSISNIRTLQSFLHRILRDVTHSGRYVHNSVIRQIAGVDKLGHLIQYEIAKILESIDDHENLLLHNILLYDLRQPTIYIRPRHVLLRNYDSPPRNRSPSPDHSSTTFIQVNS